MNLSKVFIPKINRGKKLKNLIQIITVDTITMSKLSLKTSLVYFLSKEDKSDNFTLEYQFKTFEHLIGKVPFPLQAATITLSL